jgi:regulator of sigma E protease
MAAAGDWLWTVLTYGGPFFFVLCLVIFIHELGHFLVGRWCGVRVESFSIGFGPEIFGFTDRQGTRWKLSIIPLGGYVKFFGDKDAASAPDFDGARQMSAADRAVSFPHKSVGQRAAVVAAGPIANFILAITLFALVAVVYGRPVHDPYVGVVQPNSPAERAGVMVGDRFMAIDGQPVRSFDHVQRIVSVADGKSLVFTFQRGGAPVDLTITPERREFRTTLGVYRAWVIGVEASRAVEHRRTEFLGPVAALGHGVDQTWHIVDRTFGYIGRLLMGRDNADQISGLPRMVQASGEVAKASGLSGLLGLAAIISVSIGLINLFPIPLLDGGHLVMYAIEAVKRRPLSERAQEWSFRIGFAVVIGLMLFATWNDIVHFVSLRNAAGG